MKLHFSREAVVAAVTSNPGITQRELAKRFAVHHTRFNAIVDSMVGREVNRAMITGELSIRKS